jgi:hypothetical protein
MFKDKNWTRVDRTKPYFSPAVIFWDEDRSSVVVFTEDLRVESFDVLTGLWESLGNLPAGHALTTVIWDPDSRIAIGLDDVMGQGVMIHLSKEGLLNGIPVTMNTPFPVPRNGAVFFDPFRRRAGVIGGLDENGNPSSAMFMLKERCP